MFRRSVLEISSRGSVRRIQKQILSQRIASLLASRKEFSTSPQKNAFPKAGSNGQQPESKNNFPKVILGGAVVGAAILAYQSGYLDQFVGREQDSSAKVGVDHKDVNDAKHLEEQVAAPLVEEANKISQYVEEAAQKIEAQTDLPHVEPGQKTESHMDLPHVETDHKVETQADLPHVEAGQRVETQTDVPHHDVLSGAEGESKSHFQHTSDATTEAPAIAVQEEHKVDNFQSKISEGGIGLESPEMKITGEVNGVKVTQVQIGDSVISEPNEQNEVKIVPDKHPFAEVRSEAAPDKGMEAANLLEAYHLKQKAEESIPTESSGEEALVSAVKELNDSYLTKDGKLVMDFLQAIHAAEKGQAELDATAFAEEKRALKEKYEKELRDLRARELMRAEEAAILDKEIKREKAKAAAAIRAIQEKMDEKLKMELEQKENEAEMNLKKLEGLSKAELAAAIASEKAAQIEKMAEANLHINALCMAFYARSEEARQIHSVHKLALGALALEDALAKGQPVQQELDALNTYLEGNDKESLLHLVLSTLPEETRHHGTDTLLQLNQKFNNLKGMLRHCILIPPGGGGILAHALAHVASWLRIKEVDPSGDGIESVISRVEGYLAQGLLAEAAEALQEGVRGSQAEEIAVDWVKRARDRAIIEQALTVLQSYATCVSLTQ